MPLEFMLTKTPLHGLVAATHTPFHPDGSLDVAAVAPQAAYLKQQGVETVFIGGSTGESHSLTLAERLALGERWAEVAGELRVVVHVGSNCLADARVLAAQAERLGAVAIAAMAPSYFKPQTMDLLIASCAEIAAAAPETPFYFYDIPALTGVAFSMAAFLERARDRVGTLAGLKFTNPDLMSYQLCLAADEGRWDLPFGVDEHLLGALAMGARGAVGSGFNFAAPVYRRLMEAFAAGDWERARLEQFRGVRLIQVLAGYGYVGAAKALMGLLGVPVGPPRLPHAALGAGQIAALRGDLEEMGFFEWIQ